MRKILNKINGLYYRQEFLCLVKESFPDPLHVYLVQDNKIIKDITNHHLFVGYSPLIFALPSLNEVNLSQTENLHISFAQANLSLNKILDNNDVVATLRLRKTGVKFAGQEGTYLYEGQHGKHSFTNNFHQFVSQLSNSLYNKKPGNVFLEGNLYTQVQIAYAIPRVISLITIAQTNLFNLFPTDLHGQVDDSHYIISLRRGGKAQEQVETIKNILVSEVHAEVYKAVYSLGKNHMQELKDKSQFLFDSELSQSLQLPLPQSATYYRELNLLDSVDYGIHRFFLFKIINQCRVQDKPSTLTHIHNVYATWRHNKGLPGNYLLR